MSVCGWWVSGCGVCVYVSVCVCLCVWGGGGRSGRWVGGCVCVGFLVSDLVSMTGLSEFNCVCVRGMGAWVGVYV